MYEIIILIFMIIVINIFLVNKYHAHILFNTIQYIMNLCSIGVFILNNKNNKCYTNDIYKLLNQSTSFDAYSFINTKIEELDLNKQIIDEIQYGDNDNIIELQIYTTKIKYLLTHYTIVIIDDISEYKKSVYKYNRLSHAVDNISSVGIQIYNQNGVVYFWNKGSEQMFKYSKNEAIGENISNLIISYNDIPLYPSILNYNYETKKDEQHVLNKYNDQLILYNTQIPFNHIKYSQSFICINMDITRQKKMESVYNLLLESLSDAVFQLDEKLNFVCVNKQFEQTTGYLNDDLYMENIDDVFIFLEGQIQFNKSIDAIIEHKQTNNIIKVQFIIVEMDYPKQYYGIFHNVTDHRILESELLQTYQMFKDVCDSCPVGIVIISEQTNRLLYINEKAKNHDLPIVNNKLDLSLLDAENNKFYPKEQNLLIETVINDKWYEFAIRNIIYKTESSKLIIVQNIDKIKKEAQILQKEIEKNTQQLICANNELESFAYVVSHDLKMPFRQIDGIVNILLEEFYNEFNDEVRTYLGYLLQSTNMANTLIESLLSLSRATRGNINLTKNVNMNYVIKQTCRSIMQKDDIVIHIHPEITMTCDVEMMKSVYLNLINNAYQFRKKDSCDQIEIGTILLDNKITYFVCDNGIGFEQHKAEKIFEIFETNRDIGSGTGVGLTTVKRIINKHNGIIWGESDRNYGACFYFRFL